MKDALNISFQFTQQAARLLGGASSRLSFPSRPLSQQPVVPGDKLKFEDIPNCPWLVVSERFWSVGAEATTLTIWLDEPRD